jgi:rifampin ADP-ribosylating transferase
VPGGVDDHHITICYLGKNVSDKAFAEACRRTREAAAQCPPMDGVLRGIDIFPPSKSSDGKVPAFVPAYVGGIGRLRRLLEDQSASEHKDYRQHVSLAYLEEGDSLPAPHPAVPVRFTHVHVKRGDEVVSYPLGGLLEKTAAVGMSHYHGTIGDLKPGDLIAPGRNPNWEWSSPDHVYSTTNLHDAYDYGIEASARRGGAPEPRVYEVEHTGPYEDDPEWHVAQDALRPDDRTEHVTSFRSAHPLRVKRDATPEGEEAWNAWMCERMGL